jgi:hypothetical protein
MQSAPLALAIGTGQRLGLCFGLGAGFGTDDLSLS